MSFFTRDGFAETLDVVEELDRRMDHKDVIAERMKRFEQLDEVTVRVVEEHVMPSLPTVVEPNDLLVLKNANLMMIVAAQAEALAQHAVTAAQQQLSEAQSRRLGAAAGIEQAKDVVVKKYGIDFNTHIVQEDGRIVQRPVTS